VLRWAYALPGLARRYARRAATNANLNDTAVRVGGSSGDAEIRATREDWERRLSG
jgi:hypothetical protein